MVSKIVGRNTGVLLRTMHGKKEIVWADYSFKYENFAWEDLGEGLVLDV